MPVPADPIAALEARIDAIDKEIARLAEERERIERALAALRGEPEPPLTSADNTNTLEPMRKMQPVERLRHSKQPHAKADRCVERFLAACHAKGETMSDAARALSTKREKVHQAQLSSALRGDRPMWEPLAKRIEERYGYAATLENWPDLRLEK